MYTKLIKLVIIIIMLGLVQQCDGDRKVRTKFKKKIVSDSANHIRLLDKIRNNTIKSSGRGFFGHGLLSLGKVLNFFPVGGERECQPSGYHVARAGICLNPYDCRQRDGKSAGDCAHGLGVCCIFEVTCGGIVQNNLTYFMSPGFPELYTGDKDCNITIDKSYAGIMQLRIDFVHFTIGQPNRKTGECDEDVMVVGDGVNNFTLCGQNHGQHIYYTLPSGSERREADELPSTKSTRLSIIMRGADMPRLWLMRLAQMPLAHSAPHNCLQYYTENNGTVKTFNYAINGRHLANQEYKACVRRNTKFCGIRYAPCDSRSFRIGPNGDAMQGIDPVDTMQQEEMMPVNDNNMQTQEDEMEGSGADPQVAPAMEMSGSAPQQSFLSMARTWSRWSPYIQHFGSQNDIVRYNGYGHFGSGLLGFGRQRCQDRVTIPCENEYFISSTSFASGVCDPHHCGNTFCPGVPFHQCHVETSISPFAVSFHFGPPTMKDNPEENIGACLRYTQLPCDS